MLDYLSEHFMVLLLTTIYIGGCLYVGWYFKKKAAEGVEGYYIAKREIPGWVISLAFFSTSASTNTYIGQAGKSFQFGLSWAWMGFIWTVFCVTSVLDIPYEWGALAIIFITCAYTIWGGMYSVLWTDAIQGIIMFGVAIIMLMLPFIYAGGVENLMEKKKSYPLLLYQ